MNIDDLKKEFSSVEKNKDEVTLIRQVDGFIEKLLSCNDSDSLDFHYSLLKNKENHYLYTSIRNAFKKRDKNIIEPFLLKKIQEEVNSYLKADAIQLLGNIRSPKILPYVREHIKSKDGNIRYRCIIVLGWMGNKDDLPLLNERLQNELNDKLRGYAATAMRQIWFAKRATAEDILPYLCHAVVKETAEATLSSIIIVIQDLLQRKFGLQERINEGIITGDPVKAKGKVIKVLKL